MEEMKTIYQVEGKLCKDFIGQISYTVCLDQTYGELDIEFSFGPQHFRPEDVTPELKQRLLDYCKKEYGMKEGTPELCWKYITMEKHSPSPSTRPENRDTNRSPGMITRSPSAPKIGSSPAMSPTRSRWLLLQSMLLLSRCFSRKKPLSKTSYVQAL